MYRALALLFWVPLLSFGQATAARITGCITDSSGAAIPGARIVVTNTGTGAVREVSSNEPGNYTVPLLEPGVYVIAVEKDGFSSARRAERTRRPPARAPGADRGCRCGGEAADAPGARCAVNL
jgi:carboxypeptidase family protein